MIELFNDPDRCEEFMAADPAILRAASASGEVPPPVSTAAPASLSAIDSGMDVDCDLGDDFKPFVCHAKKKKELTGKTGAWPNTCQCRI